MAVWHLCDDTELAAIEEISVAGAPVKAENCRLATEKDCENVDFGGQCSRPEMIQIAIDLVEKRPGLHSQLLHCTVTRSNHGV